MGWVYPQYSDFWPWHISPYLLLQKGTNQRGKMDFPFTYDNHGLVGFVIMLVPLECIFWKDLFLSQSFLKSESINLTPQKNSRDFQSKKGVFRVQTLHWWRGSMILLQNEKKNSNNDQNKSNKDCNMCIYLYIYIYIYMNIYIYFWANYNDLSRGHPKWWFRIGIPHKIPWIQN